MPATTASFSESSAQDPVISALSVWWVNPRPTDAGHGGCGPGAAQRLAHAGTTSLPPSQTFSPFLSTASAVVMLSVTEQVHTD